MSAISYFHCIKFPIRFFQINNKTLSRRYHWWKQFLSFFILLTRSRTRDPGTLISLRYLIIEIVISSPCDKYFLSTVIFFRISNFEINGCSRISEKWTVKHKVFLRHSWSQGHSLEKYNSFLPEHCLGIEIS